MLAINLCGVSTARLDEYRRSAYNRFTYMEGPLKPADFHILLALAEGPLHGYAIMKHVERESSGGVRLEIGSLYRLLARLLDSGMIEEAEPDQRRRFYRLSRVGRRVLKAEAVRLNSLVEKFRESKLLPEGDA